MAQEYSLLREPWIPVLMGNGQARRVGILEAFSEAHHIRHVAASNPMDRVAILRFLLALLYWCKGHPESDADLSFREPFPPAWFAKIKENACRFNMLGDGNRFYQNPACHTAKLEHTTDYLIHEVPTGNNFWHFRHATDGVEGLCPACCAMGLVRLPVFTHLGGRGTSSATYKFVGVNATPPLYAVPVGRTLSETLRLSWRRTDWPLGTPEWETPNLRLPREGDVPLLTGLTWVPRSVWLGDPEGAERPCVL